MDQRKLSCACGQQFTEEEFARHYGTCQPFKQQFKEFDSKFGELLKAYSEPKERLLIVKFLLKQYINVIDKKLKKYFASLGQNPPQVGQYQNGNVPPPIGGGNAPPSMSNMSGMNQNQFSQNSNNSSVYSNPGSSFNNNMQNPYAGNNNNPYRQNPYQNSNKNMNNPYQNQNQNQNQNMNQNMNKNDNPYRQNLNQNNNNQNPYNQSSNPFLQGNMGNNNNNNNNDSIVIMILKMILILNQFKMKMRIPHYVKDVK